MHSKEKKSLSSYCHLLGVSRSGYYAWKQRPVSAKQQEYQDSSRLYWQTHEARVGAPSLVHDMRELGYDLSERTVGRRLRVMGLQTEQPPAKAGGLAITTKVGIRVKDPFSSPF